MIVRTVVVAVDFSTGSEAALVYAATLAARTDATLHVVYASLAQNPLPDHELTVLAARLENFVGEALGETSASVLRLEVVVLQGPTVPVALIRGAVDLRADLLVVGTRGLSGFDRFLVGSVAEACVASAPCPVLTVPQGAEAREPSAESPVLVAVDFTGVSHAAVDAGRAVAALYGAPLELAHVARDAGPYTGLLPNALTLAGIDDTRDEAVQRRLARFAGDAPAVFHAALGAPSRQIAALATARGAGAIVMGTHGRTEVTQAILGSTTAATLQRATCPVLTVRCRTRAVAPRWPMPSAYTAAATPGT